MGFRSKKHREFMKAKHPRIAAKIDGRRKKRKGKK